MDFGQTVTLSDNEAFVRVWGQCDSEQAWLLRDGLHDLVVTDRRSITLDVSDLRFEDFTAVAILVGALVRTRRRGGGVPAVQRRLSGAEEGRPDECPRRRCQVSPTSRRAAPDRRRGPFESLGLRGEKGSGPDEENVPV